MEMDEHLDHEIPQQSPVVWLFRALGIRYTFLLPFFFVLALLLAVIAIAKFKTPYLTAVLLAVVPLPLFWGTVGVIDGIVASLSVISISDAQIKSSDLAQGGAMSLVSMQVGLILTIPLYLLAIAALSWRAFSDREALDANQEPPVGAKLSPRS